MVTRPISCMALNTLLEVEGGRDWGRQGSELAYLSYYFLCSMVLSREAVERIVELGHGCPTLDYPDDLFLGSTARQLEFNIVHSPLFHQV